MNYAIQLNHIGAYPVKIIPFSNDQSPNFTYVPSQTNFTQPRQVISQWNNIPSGLKSQQQYVFALLDMYDQVVLDDFSSTLQLFPNGFSSSDRSLFSSMTSVTAQGGLYCYQDFIFNFKASQTMNVTFVSDAVEEQDYEFAISPYPSINSTIVEVNFRDCKLGEYLMSSGQFTRCQECQVGYWSVGKSGFDTKQACTECDQTSTLCLGGSKIGPKPGYWRMNETSNIVKACDDVKVCLGNDPSLDYDHQQINPAGKCAPKYQGNMCDKCISGYGKMNNSECVDCKTSALQYTQLFFILVIQIALFIYGVKEVIDMSKEVVNNHVQSSKKANGAILIRIFVNYLQIVSLIEEVPIVWPVTFKKTLSVNSQLSLAKGFAISSDCFLQLGRRATSIQETFLKTLLVVLMPFICIILSILFWIIYFKLKKRRIFDNEKFINQVVATIVVICFNLQPNIIKSCFELFQCVNLYRTDTPVHFLVSDYDLQCWTHEHLSWLYLLAIPALIVWGLAFPIFVYIILRKNITNLESIDFKKKYSFLYIGYKNKKCYWELFIMLRKLLLICIIVFAQFYSINLEIYLSVVLVHLSYIAQKQNKPYSDERLNNLENVSLASAGLINFCGLYFQIARDAPGLDFIVMGIGLAGNFYFIIKFVRLFLAFKMEALKHNKYLMKPAKFIIGVCSGCLNIKRVEKIVKSAQRLLQRCIQAAQRLLDVISGNSTNSSNVYLPQSMKSPERSLNSERNSANSSFDVGVPLADIGIHSIRKSRFASSQQSSKLGDVLRRLGPVHIDKSLSSSDLFSDNGQKVEQVENSAIKDAVELNKEEKKLIPKQVMN